MRILEYTRINRDLLYKEKTSYASKGVLALHYYKNLKTLRKQVCIIYPNSDTLEWRKDSKGI